MENFNLYNPTKIIFGKGILNQLGDEAANCGKRALILIGKGSVKRSGLYDKALAALAEKGIESITYEGIRSNPIYQDADAAVAQAKDFGVDMILAIGGGSVIDTAKAIAMGYYHSGSVWDFYERKAQPKQALPLIAVLTLAATGTEMNASTVIQDTENGMKKGYSHRLLYPKVSFLDPTLTYSVPRDYTAYGIVDLMAHAMEVYFSKAENELTSHYIASILKLAIKHGPIALQEPDNYAARAHLLWLSTSAINGTLGVGRGGGDWGVHALEHSLSVLYDLPHGAGLSIVYPAWLRFHQEQIIDKLAFLALSVFDLDKSLSDKELANLFILKLEAFYRSIESPVRLQDVRVNASEKERILANFTLNSASGANYPLTEKEHKGILDLMFN